MRFRKYHNGASIGKECSEWFPIIAFNMLPYPTNGSLPLNEESKYNTIIVMRFAIMYGTSRLLILLDSLPLK